MIFIYYVNLLLLISNNVGSKYQMIEINILNNSPVHTRGLLDHIYKSSAMYPNIFCSMGCSLILKL